MTDVRTVIVTSNGLTQNAAMPAINMCTPSVLLKSRARQLPIVQHATALG